jgi:hypothetical protein
MLFFSGERKVLQIFVDGKENESPRGGLCVAAGLSIGSEEMVEFRVLSISVIEGSRDAGGGIVWRDRLSVCGKAYRQGRPGSRGTYR